MTAEHPQEEIEMDRSERVVLTNMCMVCDGKGNVLVEEETIWDLQMEEGQP